MAVDAMQAAKLLDQAKDARQYAEKLVIAVQGIFRTKKINHYEYERLINLATCHQLLNEDMSKQLERCIAEDTNKRLQIDVRV